MAKQANETRYVFDGTVFVDQSTKPPRLAGYIFNFKRARGFFPGGQGCLATEEQIASHNRALSDMELDAMVQHGRAMLYERDTPEGLSVGFWSGGPNFKVNYQKRSNHFVPNCWRSVTRFDYWFTGPDKKAWHGVNIGDNQIVRCKRLKE